MLQDCVAPENNGDCIGGHCTCEPGFTGASCHDSCEPTNNGVEICDGLDNNCDGKIDEEGASDDDPENCGGCGNDCLTSSQLWPDFQDQLPPNMKAAECNNGVCQIAECNLGYTDDPVFSYPDCNYHIKQLVAGYYHTCALLSDNSIQCWGFNSSGQLGRDIGNETSSHIPGSVTGLSIANGVSIQHIAAGNNHTCALLSDNSIQCWGENYEGQLGNTLPNDETRSIVPVAVEGLF